MEPDLWYLYKQMLRSRRFEEKVTRLWEEGKISGEMHLGIGEEAIAAGVIDLRTVSPLDKETITTAIAITGRMLVVDEDYEGFGLSGELAAIVLEADIPFKYRRVCTQTTIPYSRELEDQTLPNTQRIMEAARQLVEN